MVLPPLMFTAAVLAMPPAESSCAMSPVDHDWVGVISDQQQFAPHLHDRVLLIGLPFTAPFTGKLAVLSLQQQTAVPMTLFTGTASDNPINLFGFQAERIGQGMFAVSDNYFLTDGVLVLGRISVVDISDNLATTPFPQAPEWTARLGRSMAYDSSTMRLIAGAPTSKRDAAAPSDEGSAFIYRRLDSGEWVEEAHLWNPGGGEGDRHGWSVAIAGDVAAVGAYGINTYGGGVCIYRFDGEAWAFETQIDSPWGGQGFFGRAVDLDGSGNVLAVGAPNSYQQDGAVYVFEHADGAWSLAHTLRAEQPVGLAPALGNYGLHVSDDASLIVASAPADEAPGFEAGAFHVFQKQGARYVETAKVSSPEPVGNGLFSAYSLEGDVIAAGQFRRNNIGGAYLYRGVLGLDCNDNGVTDACEVHEGLAEDANFNFIPDECELIGDLNSDGTVTSADLNLLLAAFGATIAYWEPALPADVDNSLAVDSADLNLLLANFGKTAPMR